MNVGLKLRQAALKELMQEHQEWYAERLRFYKRRGMDNNQRKNAARRDLVEYFNDELQVKMGNIPKSDMLYGKFIGKVTRETLVDELQDLAAEYAEQVLRYTYYREYRENFRRHRWDNGRVAHSTTTSRLGAILDVKAKHLDEYCQLVSEMTNDMLAKQQSLGDQDG